MASSEPVRVHGQVDAGHAGLVHVLRGDLSVGLEQVKHRFGGDEAAFTMRDGHAVRTSPTAVRDSHGDRFDAHRSAGAPDGSGDPR